MEEETEDTETLVEKRALPEFAGDEHVVAEPLKFRKLHRRAGEKWGLYLAETKSRFVVSDGQREVLGLFAVGGTLAIILLLLLFGRAFDLWSFFVLAAILVFLIVVETWMMERKTTTWNRRTGRMVQEVTKGLCFTKKSEYDLDDVVGVKKDGEGRAARILVEFSGGEEVALTYTGLKLGDDLKTIGPGRMNQFLKRIRGQAKRKYPPPYVLARAAWSSEREGDLSFEAQTMIKVLDTDESGWWKGKLREGSIGVFPCNWTVEMSPSEVAD